MEKLVIRKWTSKETLESTDIVIYQVNECKVVEFEYTTPLDGILLEFTKTRARKRKEELKQEYRETASRLNSLYKNNLYNKEL